MTRPRHWLFLAAVSGSLLVADQVSKFLAVKHLTHLFDVVGAHTLGAQVAAFWTEKNVLARHLSAEPVRVFDAFWSFRYTENPGAAFSFLAGTGAHIRLPFFHLVTIAAVIFIVTMYKKLNETQWFQRCVLALLLGGALGNATDRILRGTVIDFIDWHWFDPEWSAPQRHFATFNVADCGVTVSLISLIALSFFARTPGQATTLPATPAPAPASSSTGA